MKCLQVYIRGVLLITNRAVQLLNLTKGIWGWKEKGALALLVPLNLIRPKPLNPRIVLLDMVGKEIDEKPTTSFEKGGRITFLRKFITVKSLVRRFNSTESDSWSERTIPNQDLDEKRTAS